MAISDRIVVMHQGAIVQQGTAEELYHHPESAFVAQFIGRTNLLAGRVLGTTDDGVEIEVAGQRHRLAGAAPHAAAGAAVHLVLRPEAIALGPPGAGTIPGTVISRTFLGEKVEYRVRVGAEELQVTAFGAQQLFGSDQPVGLRLPTAGVSILPGGAT